MNSDPVLDIAHVSTQGAADLLLRRIVAVRGTPLLPIVVLAVINSGAWTVSCTSSRVLASAPSCMPTAAARGLACAALRLKRQAIGFTSQTLAARCAAAFARSIAHALCSFFKLEKCHSESCYTQLDICYDAVNWTMFEKVKMSIDSLRLQLNAYKREDCVCHDVDARGDEEGAACSSLSSTFCKRLHPRSPSTL